MVAGIALILSERTLDELIGRNREKGKWAEMVDRYAWQTPEGDPQRVATDWILFTTGLRVAWLGSFNRIIQTRDHWKAYQIQKSDRVTELIMPLG